MLIFTQKYIAVVFACALASSAQASIPYCAGSKFNGSNDSPLQNAVAQYATQNGCEIGTSCLANKENVLNYAISWSKPCPAGSAETIFYCNPTYCQPTLTVIALQPQAYADPNAFNATTNAGVHLNGPSFPRRYGRYGHGYYY